MQSRFVQRPTTATRPLTLDTGTGQSILVIACHLRLHVWVPTRVRPKPIQGVFMEVRTFTTEHEGRARAGAPSSHDRECVQVAVDQLKSSCTQSVVCERRGGSQPCSWKCEGDVSTACGSARKSSSGAGQTSQPTGAGVEAHRVTHLGKTARRSVRNHVVWGAGSNGGRAFRGISWSCQAVLGASCVRLGELALCEKGSDPLS